MSKTIKKGTKCSVINCDNYSGNNVFKQYCQNRDSIHEVSLGYGRNWSDIS